jgi:hypothetical protein
VSHPLDSARLKLEWADRHLDALQREGIDILDAQAQGDPPITVTYQFDPKTSRYVFRVKELPELPTSIGLMVGDAVHNLRCAADHLAWQLVRASLRTEPNRPWEIQFPIYDSPDAFAKNLNRRLPGVPAEIRALIAARQPHDGRNAWAKRLSDLSNADKHRVIPVAFILPAQADLTITPHGCRWDEVSVSTRPKRLEVGAELFWVHVVVDEPNHDVEVQFNLLPYIGFDDGVDVVDGLRRIRSELAALLRDPAVLAVF